MLIEGIDFGPAYDLWEQKKAKDYKKRLDELRNTQIIYHQKSLIVHHGLDDPYYQAKLQELVSNIYDKK